MIGVKGDSLSYITIPFCDYIYDYCDRNSSILVKL